VFGDDPKKKFVNPPPFRITKGMVDAMGGQKGNGGGGGGGGSAGGGQGGNGSFQQFCRKALEAYKELRHNAVLIMSLLRLMKDAGIEALILNADAKLQVNE
jgi:phosphatidylinositol kinase/protein kinase (PI-3  family)